MSLKGTTIEKMAPTMHSTSRKRVFSGCVHSTRWYTFSVSVRQRLAAKRTSVAPGVLTSSMSEDVTC